ncbi:hypothetical protein [Chryseobacterium lathyri]|uniref:Glycosyltransferase RgtA/B/C/D-like domain-containing protein n=1 Tax=Chryseobacterium lathyri TaxID=395933 RepID=A0ABT9SMZ6_9FLAO|nr:hypothetical protein [Chryseobacterium lathyri]MDP9959805.1 hypothetical protein [Chryseobacterium lathyri]
MTHYIQEDAFITWRVAQNLLDYGIIGFNGETKASASTSHLYIFISCFFNLIFGKEYFIEPLLIFNSILFTIGTLLLAHLTLKNPWHKAIFIFLISILPPSIKISILGTEYGILFFLEMALLYYGFNKDKKWALVLFPVLIIFTRIDTVIFLGIIFLVDVFWNRKIRWKYVLGGILGILSVLSFNWLYFGEWYAYTFTFAQNFDHFLTNFGNFWGMLKLPGNFNPVTIITLIFELLCFIYLIRQREKRNCFLWMIFVFGWMQQIIFISQNSLSDLYYWIPQLLLFVPVLIFVLEQKEKRNLWLSLLIVFYILPMAVFQTMDFIEKGNAEWNQHSRTSLSPNTNTSNPSKS